jgi:ADP-ribosylglycohydrolase
MFRQWLQSDHPEPYQSIANGAAIRAKPIGYYARSLDEAESLALQAAQITHDTPEGMNAAMAVASTIWMRRHGYSVELVKEHLKRTYFYSLFNAKDYNEFRNNYKFSASCDDNVPPAIACGLNYHLESAIRHAVALGYDADTMACIAGGISGIEPNDFTDRVYNEFLTEDIREIVDAFDEQIQ